MAGTTDPAAAAAGGGKSGESGQPAAAATAAISGAATAPAKRPEGGKPGGGRAVEPDFEAGSGPDLTVADQSEAGSQTGSGGAGAGETGAGAGQAAGAAGATGAGQKPGESGKPGDTAGGGAVEPGLEDLSYLETLAGAKPAVATGGAGGEQQTTESDLTKEARDKALNPDGKASLEEQVKNAQEFINRRNQEIGELRPLKKLREQVEALKPAFEFDARGNIAGLSDEFIQREIERRGLRVVAPGQGDGTGGQDPLDALEATMADAVLKTLSPDTALEGLTLDEKLTLIEQDGAMRRRYERELRRGQDNLAREQQDKRDQTNQAAAREREQIAARLVSLSKTVKHFNELLPVMEVLQKQYPNLPAAVGGLAALEIYHKLAEVSRFPAVLKAAVAAAKKAGETATLQRLGLTEQELAGAAAGAGAGGAEAGEPETGWEEEPTGEAAEEAATRFWDSEAAVEDRRVAAAGKV